MSSELIGMNKEQFCAAIKLPKHWISNNLYPDSFFEMQLSESISSLSRLDDEGFIVDGEHYRNALYWYWLRNGIDKSLLIELIELEPDRKLRSWFLKKMDAP
jgi:hypothetical protein